MRMTAALICAINLAASGAVAGTVSFDPPTAAIAPGTPTSFIVTISATDTASFTSVDLLLSSDTAGLNMSFVYDPDFMTTLPPPDPFPAGVFASDLFVGGFQSTPWMAPLVIGTLTIDTTGLAPGTFDGLILVRATNADGTGIGLSTVLGEGLMTEAISGMANLSVTDPAVDTDNDGVPNDTDAFPNDPTETVDTDANGVGNNADPDDDGDGVMDVNDAFPLDATETMDTDADGVGDNGDAFVDDPTETLDTDADGVGNNADLDDDNDGVADVNDAFPLNPAETTDTNGNGIGDNADQQAGGAASGASGGGPVLCGANMAAAMLFMMLGLMSTRWRRRVR